MAILLVARVAYTAGPREMPEKYPDFGGTPDLVLSGDVGMGGEELDALLQALDSSSLKERLDAAIEIRSNAAGCESTLREALWGVGSVPHGELKDVLKRASTNTPGDGGISGGLIQMQPRTPAINLATRVVVMLQALAGLDTMAGYKVLLDFSGRHAGAFRALVGELMVQSGLNALPALIYGRGSKNEELHMFAVAWIRDMGNPLLSQQIQGIRNSRRLAQLLEAYASVNELDAIDVTLSCANHESALVRDAARASMTVYGRNGKWSIFREYENAFGEEPAGDNYEQWAAALYQAWDTQRESSTAELFQQGLAAANQGQYVKMDAAYRKLLAGTPLYPHRAQMADGYLAYSAKLAADGHQSAALKNIRMARRLSDEGSEANRKAAALLKWMEIESLREQGALDVSAYEEMMSIADVKDAATSYARYGQQRADGSTRGWIQVLWATLALFISGLLIYWRIRLRQRSSQAQR